MSNIREILGHLKGQMLLEITTEDEDDRKAGNDGFIELMFSGGDTLKFFILDSEEYKAGAPLCFSDPCDSDESQVYIPSDEDKNAGAWAVVEWRSESGVAHHVVPTKGRHHFLGEECWCKPKVEMNDNGILMYTHEEELV